MFPTKIKEVEFEVTCFEPITRAIPQKTYLVGDPELEMSIPQFDLEPANLVPSSLVSEYKMCVTPSKLSTPLDPGQITSLPSFATPNFAGQFTLTIETESLTDVGYYTFVLV